MLSRARLLILANLLGSLAFTACGGPEASHFGSGSPGTGGSGGIGAAGSSGLGGAGNVSGAAGDTSGVAGSGTPDASVTGLAGDTGTGVAGMTGAAGVGAAGAGVAGAGAAGAGAAGAGAAGAGVAGAGAAGAGAAGAGAAGKGAAGAGAAGAGAAGAGVAGAGAAGAGAAGAGAAGVAAVGEYTNYCSPVHWAFSANPAAVNATDYPSNVADGTLNDRWSTGANQAPGQYIQIDFGGTVSLTQVAIDNTNQPTDYPNSYTVGLSTNNTTFTTVGMGTPAAMTLIETANFAATSARYLRVTQTGTANVYWSVDELRVACTVPGNNAGLVDPYDPTYWKVTASVSSPNYPPALAIDSDVTTRWSTGADQAGGEVFTLDLSGPASVSQIWLDAGALQDFPAMYKLELSTNGTTYTQVATGVGTQLTKITFPTQMARYFRITQTGASTVWWSIYNITVHP